MGQAVVECGQALAEDLESPNHVHTEAAKATKLPQGVRCKVSVAGNSSADSACFFFRSKKFHWLLAFTLLQFVQKMLSLEAEHWTLLSCGLSDFEAMYD
jgi:hypothetical protein